MADRGHSDFARAILLVEDDPAQQALVGDILRAAGFAVHAAAGVTDAIVKLGDPALHLVLSDFKLADGDGLGARAGPS